MWFKVIFLVILSHQSSYSFSTGGGTTACATLTPSHAPHVSQTSEPPYTITLSDQFVLQGQSLTLTIASTTPGIFFRGFMIQARTLEDQLVIGRFTETDTARAVNCGLLPVSSVATHRTNNEKSQITLTWEAPTTFFGVMNFHFTVVQTQAIFWTGLQSALFVVVPPATEVPSTEIPPGLDFDVYEGCEITKVCFGGPAESCLNSRNCDLFGAVTFENGIFTFELLSKPGESYIALGLSRDRMMGDDSVVECVNENNNITAFTSFTTVGPTVEAFGSPRTNVNQDIIRLKSSILTDGKIYCQVERDTISVVHGKIFDLIDQKHYLLLASGIELRENSVGQHLTSVISSENAVNLTIPANIEAGRRVLVMVHGSLMVVAWIGTASIGIFLARYFKDTWKDQLISRKHHVWFVWHFVSMLLTWALTIASFIIIFVDVGAWRTSVHSVAGTVVMVFVSLQPIGAIFRPKPTHHNRPIFNFLHFAGGNITYILAIITIFYAVPMAPALLPDWTTYVILAFFVFYLSMHLIMTTIRICGEVKRKSKLGSSKNQPYQLLSKTLLGFFLLTVLLFVIALILIIVLQP